MALDGLRGIAALSVMIMHIGDALLLPYVMPQAYLAVPFFFILSGFVISFVYEDRLMLRGPVAEFMAVRGVRLYPMLVFGLAVSILLSVVRSAVGGNPTNGSVFLLLGASLAMIPLPGPTSFPLLAPQWSLSFELWGNLAHYFLRRMLTDKVLAVAFPIAFGAMSLGAFHHGGLGTGWNWANAGAGLVTFGFCYGLGIFLCRLWKRRVLPNIRMPVWVGLAIFTATLVIPQELRTVANTARDLFCTVIVYPIVIISALNITMDKRVSVFVNILGRLSYPLYIVHLPIATFFCLIILHFKLEKIYLYVSIALISAVVVLISYAVLTVFDEPLRRFLKRRNEQAR